MRSVEKEKCLVIFLRELSLFTFISLRYIMFQLM